MTQPFSGFSVGAITYPLVSPPTNSLLRDGDAPVFFALDFWNFVLRTYIEPRLIYEAAQCSAPISISVAQKYPYLPQDDHFTDNQYQFPLLACGRTETLTGRFTAAWEHDRGGFDLLYVLPPLSAGQSERILPILHAVYTALREKTTYGFDPGYTPLGGTAGQSPWAAGFANCERVGFGDPYRDNAPCATYGFLEKTGNIFFPSLRMRGFFVERDAYTPSPIGKFTGADITASIKAPDGTVVSAVAQQATQLAPTIVSLAPTGGPIAGGTAVTITGTLFLPGPTPQQRWVTFGGLPATSIVRVSATTLTCVSPASSGAGSVDVTVTNADGQAVTSPNAFTYS